MNVRKAVKEDMDRISDIFAYAREFMAKTGNPTQWGNDRPEKEILLDDIEKGNLYVMEKDGEIHGVFAFIIGEDSTYRVIEDGKWISDDIYGTIHRIAGDGKEKGVFETCLGFCETLIKNIRIDTHSDNKVMQYLIEKNGFQKCGIIYASDNTPRIAYQKVTE